MAAVRVSSLSGATVLHLGLDSLPLGTEVDELRWMVAEQVGQPFSYVVLLSGTEELQGTLEAVPAAGTELQLTAVVKKEEEEEGISELVHLLCKGDGTACLRLGEIAPKRHSARFLTADALRAAVALLKAGDSETSDAAIRVLANAAAQQGETPCISITYLICRDIALSDAFKAPQAWSLTAEALAVRDTLLAAGALRALPAVWHRLWREGKIWEEEPELQHLLFRLLRGSPAPAPEEVAQVLPLLMDFTYMSSGMIVERVHLALLCAQQPCCDAGNITALFDAGLLPLLRPLLSTMYFPYLYSWPRGALALLHCICAHGSEEQHDRVVSDGWLPILLDPLDRLSKEQALDGDEVCKAYGLHIAAMLAAAVGQAAPGQGHFMALCELLVRLAAAGRRADLQHALPWLLPALARYRPSILRPSRRREAARAVRAVLMAGKEHWALVQVAGFDERVLEKARRR